MFLEPAAGARPRVVITADPELDDSNSLVRYLLYSSDFRTEGLIYASSQFHWKGDGRGTSSFVPGREYRRFGLKLCPCTSWRWAPGERFIDAAVDAYAKAYPNLRVHDPRYPSPALLKSKIRWGNVDFDGEMTHDTPGSDLIKSLLLDSEESPVYLHAWGGQSTIARALMSIEEQYRGAPAWPAIRAKVIRKAVIHPSGDQDDTYANYIKPHWPEIRYREQQGGVPLGYNSDARVSPPDSVYYSAAWTRANISARGPLGAFYRVWGDGRQMVEDDKLDYFGIRGKSAEELRRDGYIVWVPVHEPGAFIGEGDTDTFLNLVDNGLLGYRGDSFGGWGGYRRATPWHDPGWPPVLPGAGEGGAAIVRAPTNPFVAPAQRDFAARMLWATTPERQGANHPPRIILRGPPFIVARAGQRLSLRVDADDPDGNAVSIRWWRWAEAGSYKGAVTLARAEGPYTIVKVPADAVPGDTIHVIAEAEDDGTPELTRYARAVIRIAK